ncbi:MAG: lectin like domain-containing protein, partial [Christensenella sp.]
MNKTKLFFKCCACAAAFLTVTFAFCSEISMAQASPAETQITQSAAVAAPDEYEPNDTLSTATLMPAASVISANIFPLGDIDCYTFEAPADKYTAISLTQPQDSTKPDLFYALKLYDSTGQLIDFCDNAGNEHISRCLAPDTYTAMVYSLPDPLTQDFSAEAYTLSVTYSAIDAYDFSEYRLVNAAFNPNAPFSFDRGHRGDTLNSGNVYASLACLSRYESIVDETADPYVLYYFDDDLTPIVDRSNSYYHAVPAAYTVDNAVMLPARQTPADNEHYKNAIYTYGALYCGIREDAQYYTSDKAYYYHPPELTIGSGHAVTVVGWDDNIPKERFSFVGSDGITYTPLGDGAFIIKNSYGTQTGTDGYLYISYYSADFSNNAATAMRARPADTRKNVIYCHDAYGYTGFYKNEHLYTSADNWAKNTFTASSAQTLEAVSFYALSPRETYDIFIETNGVRTYIASGANEYAGYYTVPLPTPAEVASGQQFSVILRQKSLDGGEVEAAVEQNVAGYSTGARAHAGESFYSADGTTWTDISAAGVNHCIKVYAYDAGKTTLTLNATDANARGNGVTGDNIEPDTFSQNTDSFTLNANYLPAQFDLRSIGAVTSVKNQGNPPTCWTFATMGSAESGLLKQESGFSSPVNISVTGDNVQALTSSGTADVYACAADVGASSDILWQFSGDLNNVVIKNRTSKSGESALLFTAAAPCKLTATAISAADGTKTANISFEITPAPTPTATPAPTATAAPTPA